jgi:LPXTG-site transpeptidase (sortase) family protein
VNRFLLATGVALVLTGGAAVGYSVHTLSAGNAAAAQAQEQLAADWTAILNGTTTLPAADDDPTFVTTVTTTPGPDIAGPTTTTITLPAIIPEEPPPAGQAVGRLLIAAAGVDWVLIEGVRPEDLAQGPGHMPGTAMPGQPGNAVISGHRTTHGAPFFNLDLLQPGDQITIQTLIGTHTYQVVQTVIVSPRDVWVVSQVPGAWLTLTTCNPKYHSTQRLIVFAQLVDGPNAAAIGATLTGSEAPPQPPGG